MTRYDLPGRIVVITGSTGGLGAALAEALLGRGARLGLIDLDGDAVQAQARALGDLALGVRGDVRDLSSLHAAMAAVAEHFGGIDVVIANAGIGTMAPMATLDPEAFERVVDINLTGVWRTFRAALPYVSERRGYLLAVSSMAAFVHSPLQSPYTATKAGVWALCDSVRLELRHQGVAVGSAHPTFFSTPMMDDVIADPAGRELWNGNASGLWKMVSIDTVVADIVRGITRRSPMIVSPRPLQAVARTAGLIRPFIDRLGFSDNRIRRASELASPSGWNDGASAER